jgi:hypothetical protein
LSSWSDLQFGFGFRIAEGSNGARFAEIGGQRRLLQLGRRSRAAIEAEGSLTVASVMAVAASTSARVGG